MRITGLIGLFNLASLDMGLSQRASFRTNSGLSLSCFLQGLYLTSLKLVKLFVFHDLLTICPQMHED